MPDVIEVPSPTREQVRTALSRTQPMFDLMVTNDWTGGRTGMIYRFLHNIERGGDLLHVDWTFGEPDYSLHEYPEILDSKVQMTLHLECPTHEIKLAQRRRGDTIYYGSVWNPLYRGAHAATGGQAYMDRLICQAVDANLMDEMGIDVDLGDPPAGFKEEGDFLVPA